MAVSDTGWMALAELINPALTPQTLGELQVGGMPLTSAPGPALTPANAPAGVTFIAGNMPLTTPDPPIAAPQFSLPGDMPLSGPPVTTFAPQSELFPTALSTAGDHGN